MSSQQDKSQQVSDAAKTSEEGIVWPSGTEPTKKPTAWSESGLHWMKRTKEGEKPTKEEKEETRQVRWGKPTITPSETEPRPSHVHEAIREEIIEKLVEPVPVERDEVSMSGLKPKPMGYPRDSSTLVDPPPPEELPPREPHIKLPDPGDKWRPTPAVEEKPEEETTTTNKKKRRRKKKKPVTPSAEEIDEEEKKKKKKEREDEFIILQKTKLRMKEKIEWQTKQKVKEEWAEARGWQMQPTEETRSKKKEETAKKKKQAEEEKKKKGETEKKNQVEEEKSKEEEKEALIREMELKDLPRKLREELELREEDRDLLETVARKAPDLLGLHIHRLEAIAFKGVGYDRGKEKKKLTKKSKKKRERLLRQQQQQGSATLASHH